VQFCGRTVLQVPWVGKLTQNHRAAPTESVSVASMGRAQNITESDPSEHWPPILPRCTTAVIFSAHAKIAVLRRTAIEAG